MPDESMSENEATYYPPPPPRLRRGADAEWEQAVGGVIDWLDTYDQANHSLDAAELIGAAHEVVQRLLDAIRERGL